MSLVAARVIYLDSSAIVKLVVREPETDALRQYLRKRRGFVASALARTEVVRSILPFGDMAVRRAADVLGRIELIRISDRVLAIAGELTPRTLRSLDAIHLATASLFGATLQRVITYDDRMAAAAKAAGHQVVAPS